MNEKTNQTPAPGDEASPPKSPLRFLLAFLPVIIFGLLVIVFLTRIENKNDTLPSVLIGKPAPALSLPELVADGEGKKITSDIFRGKTTLVNVWASWCVPCRQEHPVLMQLNADKRFQIVGVNYKDDPKNALGFLKELGNPFDLMVADRKGRQMIDWGVYGVPESYIVDKNGIITHKHVGPLTPQIVEESLMPAIEKAIAVKLAEPDKPAEQ